MFISRWLGGCDIWDYCVDNAAFRSEVRGLWVVA